MEKRAVEIRQYGPLAKLSGAITSTDVYEAKGAPTGRERAFRDALTRANGAVEGVPTHAKEWGRWLP